MGSYLFHTFSIIRFVLETEEATTTVDITTIIIKHAITSNKRLFLRVCQMLPESWFRSMIFIVISLLPRVFLLLLDRLALPPYFLILSYDVQNIG